jgi:hypothetical protein
VTTTLTHPVAGRWIAASHVAPDDWARATRAVDAGFFHSPPGLGVGAPRGEPLYLRYLREDQVVGVALAVRSRCRLSGSPRHAYFPTWPAYAAEVDRWEADTALARTLRDLGVADVRWDSFDAGCTPLRALSPDRTEYVIDLAEVEASLTWPPSSGHRRSVRRGEREGWRLEVLTGPARARAIAAVMERVVERASGRGVEMTAEIPTALREPGTTGDDGLVVHAALQGETLLAAALIGRCTRRAFFLMGGATPAGYQCGASVWLHARLASQFAADGLRHYNLGGAPVSARHDSDPAHGLHRFKLGFGSTPVPCAGDRWILGPGHVRSHRLLQWASRWVA